MPKTIDLEAAKEKRAEYERWIKMWQTEYETRLAKADAQAQKYVAAHKQAAHEAAMEVKKYERLLKTLNALVAASYVQIARTP